MKKIMSLMLGLSLLTGAAATVAFAQDKEAPKKEKKAKKSKKKAADDKDKK